MSRKTNSPPDANSRKPTAQSYTFPAPSRGWVTTENLAMAQPGAAIVLENMIPTTRGARLRGGSQKYATLAGGGSVRALFGYVSGIASRLFASTNNGIFDITTPGSPTAPISATVSSFITNGRFVSANFATAGGSFLICVNGTDPYYVYDGSTWSNLPGMSGGPGVNGDHFNFVFSHKSRLYFLQKNTLTAWFLPVGSIGGALSDLSLYGVFKRGGSLMFASTWSQSAGDGLQDYCVFVTNQGEIAVYQGSNPTSTSDWGLVGRYDLSAPLSVSSFTRAGGDLLVCTKDGLIPLSAAVKTDRAAMRTAAVSKDIDPDWRYFALSRAANSVSITKCAARGFALIGAPKVAGEGGYCLCVNLATGAWGSIVGWDVVCATEYLDNLYFGSSDGSINIGDVGGTDNGQPYYGTYIGLPDSLGAVSVTKTYQMVRGTLMASAPFSARISVTANYKRETLSSPDSAASVAQSLWDVGKWDIAMWDSRDNTIIQSDWISCAGTGFVVSPVVQLTSGTVNTPDVEIISVDALYEAGGVVV